MRGEPTGLPSHAIDIHPSIPSICTGIGERERELEAGQAHLSTTSPHSEYKQWLTVSCFACPKFKIDKPVRRLPRRERTRRREEEIEAFACESPFFEKRRETTTMGLPRGSADAVPPLPLLLHCPSHSQARQEVDVVVVEALPAEVLAAEVRFSSTRRNSARRTDGVPRRHRRRRCLYACAAVPVFILP